MTKEDAIIELKNFGNHCYPNEEFMTAIQVLEQEIKINVPKDHIREAINNTHYCEGLMEALCICTQIPTATIEDTFKTMLEDVRAVLIECLKERGKE